MKRNRPINKRVVWMTVIGACGCLAMLLGLRELTMLPQRPGSQAQYALVEGCHVNVAAGSLHPPPKDPGETGGTGGNRFSWLDVLRILLWSVWTGAKVMGGLINVIVGIVVMFVVGLGLV